MSTTTPPHFGLIFPAHASPASLPAFARRTQSLGFETLYVVEDCFLSGAIAMTAAALSATDTLKLGIGLMPVPVRNAAVTAMELGTIAKLFPGRLEVGFGHGVEPWMEQIGARPARRLAALAETVEAVRALLAGETVTTSGSHVQLRAVTLEAAPADPPGLLVGTTGPGGLRVAGRCADGILLPEGCGPAFVKEAVAAAGAAASGERSLRTVVYSWLSLDDDPHAATRKLEPAVRHWLDGGLYPGPYRAAGIDPSTSGEIAGDAALLREVAIMGGPQACADGISRLVAAGADTVAFVAQGDDAEKQIERLATDVRPLL